MRMAAAALMLALGSLAACSSSATPQSATSSSVLSNCQVYMGPPTGARNLGGAEQVVYQVDRALPCNWSGDAIYDHRPSYSVVIWLAPLDAHTRAIADAVIARYQVSSATFTLKAGKRSFAQVRADEVGGLMPKSTSSTCYSVAPDGSFQANHHCYELGSSALGR